MSPPTSLPRLLKITRLDAIHFPHPTFDTPHTYTEYATTPPTDSVIASRIADSDVVITTRVPITRWTLEQCPRLRLVAVMAVGTDMVDLEACRERAVEVCNVPGASNESVANHAIALYFALRRNLLQLHQLTTQGEEWPQKGTLNPYFGGLPITAREEIMGIYGVGDLGNRIATIGRALGMTVLLSARKPLPSAPSLAIPDDRTPFHHTLTTSTIHIISLPLSSSPSTHHTFSTPEFHLMRPDALLVHVSRGGVVDENALVQALREGRIKGAGVDVFENEPEGREGVLVKFAQEQEQEQDWGQEGGERGARGMLILSPHVAWYARSSVDRIRGVVAECVDGWARGESEGVGRGVVRGKPFVLRDEAEREWEEREGGETEEGKQGREGKTELN